MKLTATISKVVLAGIAVVYAAGAPLCYGQQAGGQKDIQKAQEFYRAGQKYMRDGDFALANEAFMKAEIVLRTGQEMPSVPPPLEIPARPADSRGIPAGADHALDPNIYYNLGAGALQKGDFMQAEAAFLRVIELTPLDKEACYNLGVLYEKYLDKPREALKFYNRYINLSDSNDGDVEQVKDWVKHLKERARE